MSREKIGFVLVVLVVFGIYLASLYGMVPSFVELRDLRHLFSQYVDMHPVLGGSLFILTYITAVALSLPIATALTVLAGFLFGVMLGTILVVLGATVGATIIFILARYFFRNFFESHFGARLSSVNEELRANGFRDVLLLRLTPLVSFSLLNVATALTKVRLRQYVPATLFGIVPFTLIYVKAGTRLSEIDSLGDVLSLQTLLVVSLVVASAFVPIILRRRKKIQQNVA